MKKHYVTLAIFASIISFSACTNIVLDEESCKDKKTKMTFGVSLEENEVSSRAIVNGLSGSNPSIIWQDKDEISVFTSRKTIGDTFGFDKYVEHENNGYFSGESYANAGYYWGLYPAQSSARLANGKLTFTIPNQQTATALTFDPKAGIQIGKAQSWDGESNPTLSLKHACAYFCIEVGEGCESVIVKAQSETGEEVKYLAGTVSANAEADISEGGVKITEYVNCQSQITLSGGTIKNSGKFLIAFIPSTKCPKIFVKTTFYPNTDRFNQPAKLFSPNTTDENGTFSFIAGRIYNLGKYESEK